MTFPSPSCRGTAQPSLLAIHHNRPCPMHSKPALSKTTSEFSKNSEVCPASPSLKPNLRAPKLGGLSKSGRDRARTCDLCYVKAVLYPAELPAHIQLSMITIRSPDQERHIMPSRHVFDNGSALALTRPSRGFPSIPLS